jgi:hypothetical protein
MKIELYQWLVPLLVVIFITRLVSQYLKGRRSFQNSILWGLTGLFIAGIAILPDQLSFPLAEKLGFKSNINAVIFIGLGISLTMNYFQSVRIGKMERRLTELVRQIAKDSPYLPDEK